MICLKMKMSEKQKYYLANISLVLIFAVVIICAWLSSCSRSGRNPLDVKPCRQVNIYELRDSTGVISRGEWESGCE